MRGGFFFGDAGGEKPRLVQGQVLTRRIGRQKLVEDGVFKRLRPFVDDEMSWWLVDVWTDRWKSEERTISNFAG